MYFILTIHKTHKKKHCVVTYIYLQSIKQSSDKNVQCTKHGIPSINHDKANTSHTTTHTQAQTHANTHGFTYENLVRVYL